MPSSDTTVILPTYQEGQTIVATVAALRALPTAPHVLVVDDDSPDGTAAAVRSAFGTDPQVRVLVRHGQRGLTGAVLEGLQAVHTPLAVVMDADGQHPPQAVLALSAAVRSVDSPPVAVGVRQQRTALPPARRIVSYGADLLARTSLALQERTAPPDSISGLFAVRVAVVVPLLQGQARQIEPRGFKVLLDLLGALPPRTAVAEVPYHFSPRTHGASKLSGHQWWALLQQLGAPGRRVAQAVAPALGVPAAGPQAPHLRLPLFLVVGASGVVVNLAVLLLLVEGLQMWPLPAAAMATAVATLTNFSLNDRVTWGDRRLGGAQTRSRLWRYGAVAAVGLLVQLLLLSLLTHGAGLHYLLADLLAIGSATALTFGLHHRWTFSPDGEPGLLTEVMGWLVRHRRTAYLLALGGQLALSAPFIHDWDGFVFLTTAHQLLAGVTPYETAQSGPAYIFNSDDPANQWYAYPPLPMLLFAPPIALVQSMGIGTPWVQRVALKAPFIIGNLLVAYTAHLLVAGSAPNGARLRRARLLEIALLFNPFLWFIAAVWGMFDAWMMAFFLGAVLLVRDPTPRRVGGAGVLMGLAILVKLLPLLFAPLLLIHVWRRGGGRAGVQLVVTSLATAMAACLPFLLRSPAGVVQQVLLLHLERPPQGLSPIAFLYYLGEPSSPLYAPMVPAVPAAQLGALSLVLLVPALLAIYLLALLRQRTERDLLLHALGTVLAFLLLSKVVNEQYLVLPLVLFALLAYDRPWGSASARAARRGLYAFTLGGLIAALLLGFHFLTFLPPDMALSLLGMSSDAAVNVVARALRGAFGPLATALGLRAAHFYILPYAISGIALLPALWSLLGQLVPLVREGIVGTASGLQRLVTTRTRMPAGVGAIGCALLLLLPSAGLALVGSDHGGTARPLGSAPGGISAKTLGGGQPLVGTFYYVWWNNPSHDPTLRYGSWQGVSQTPAQGYYQSLRPAIAQDLRQMHAAGIDVAVVSYAGIDLAAVRQVYAQAPQAAVTVAPMLELSNLPPPRGSEVPPREGAYRLDGATADQLVELLTALRSQIDSRVQLRTETGRAVIFLYDSQHAALDLQDPKERAALIGAATRLQGGVAPSTPPPTDVASLTDAPGAPYLSAQALRHRMFWAAVQKRIEWEVGPVALIGGVNYATSASPFEGVAISDLEAGNLAGNFLYSPSLLWVEHAADPPQANEARWAAWLAHLRTIADSQRQPRMVSVLPVYDDTVKRPQGFVIPPSIDGVPTYERQWCLARQLHPDLVLVATFNEYFEGSAIEPSIEYGDSLLQQTAMHGALLRADTPQGAVSCAGPRLVGG